MAHSARHRLGWHALALAAAAAIALVLPVRPFAQMKIKMHLNPVVEKLSQGKHVFGVQTLDYSFENASALAQDPDIDYVYLNFEHTPMDFTTMQQFLYGMTNKAEILQKGNAQPNVVTFARFAPYGREGHEWYIKQALDIGLWGILFNNVETKEQAEKYVKNMRYVPRKGTSPRLINPEGVRGAGGPSARWFWGVDDEEYFLHADLYPLNPDGDLMAWMMIETELGVKNAGEICSVPGVGGIYLGSGGDLHMSLGLTARDDPAVEEALLSVTRVCTTKGVAVGGTVTAKSVRQRIKQGWKILNFGHAGGGLNVANAEARKAALTAGAKR
jgi:4-hydroxy-2-oxoheptanedioate aldolase